MNPTPVAELNRLAVTVEYAHREWDAYDHVVHIKVAIDQLNQAKADALREAAERRAKEAKHIKRFLGWWDCQPMEWHRGFPKYIGLAIYALRRMADEMEKK